MTLGYEWVFFDAVDTLFRVRGSVGGFYAAAARRHGVEADAGAIDAGFRHAMRGAPPLCFPGAAPSDIERLEQEWWHAVVRQSFAALGSFVAFDVFFAEVFEAFRTTAPWELYAGAQETAARLRAAGLRLAVVSDMDSRLPDILAAFGLSEMFEAVVLASRTGVRKHDGALFTRALEVTGARCGAVVHVGDSLRTDVAGAQMAGITPIFFDPERRGGTPPGIVAVRSLAELPRVLGVGPVP